MLLHADVNDAWWRLAAGENAADLLTSKSFDFSHFHDFAKVAQKIHTSKSKTQHNSTSNVSALSCKYPCVCVPLSITPPRIV